MRRSILVTATWALVALMIGPLAQAALADQAPFWESPVGLVPGNPDIRVRMAAETVEIEVVERGDEIHALVQASFSMVNDGPEAILKVGFPAIADSLFDALATPDAQGRQFADAPVLFSPHALRAFKVSVDDRELRSWRQDVPAAADAGFGGDWLMWDMSFPSAQTTRVDVAYEQVLTDRATDVVVQPMYVLRTGALWYGDIGEATVTMRATSGGTLIGGPELYMRTEPSGVVTYPRADQVYGPADAAEASPTQIVWRLSNVEPTRDVGATYVRASAWSRFVEADEAILSGTASAEQYRQAVDLALSLMGGPHPCGDTGEAACVLGAHRVPRGLVDRLAGSIRERARIAAEMAPDDPNVWVTSGDVEFWFAMPDGKHHGELACWPSNAADAYERAIAGGAASATAHLAGLQVSARQGRNFADHHVDTCTGQPDPRFDTEMIRATVENANGVWSRAISRYGGEPDQYDHYFAGSWLDERTAEVAALRESNQYREAHLEQMKVTDVTIMDTTTAAIETIETWQDRTYAAGGALVRDSSGRLRQRYDMQKIGGAWKIVSAVIVRD